MKKLSIFLAILIFLSAGLAAQTAPAGQGVPTVTQINVEARNNLIRLTWVDSPEARGPVYIFRSARPFTDSIPANIRPVVVRYGTQYYIDDTDDIGSLYYFVAASDIYGRRYDTIIPQINSANVNFAQPDAPAPTPVITMPEPAPIEGLSNLKAVMDGEKVTITFNNTHSRRNTILYRSTRPVRSPQDLRNAVIVQPATDSFYEDYPVPGPSWYYALVYEDEVSSGNISINPGINTTTSAVVVTASQAAGRSMRYRPLPELTLSDMQGGFLSNQTQQHPLGAESIIMLRNTQTLPKEQLELKRPRVFVIDLQTPAGGEESALFQIVKEYFETFEWEGACTILRHFLSLPRSRDVEARARFYLGQSLYFTGSYREALMQFLSFRSYHQIEANIWIDAVLAAMVQ
ncbi:MAG: hypothetical protein LBU88_10585 [Treponema sp.]|jgi:hypothetical protein|nr:hypothetical protein [Treponema sp.]